MREGLSLGSLPQSTFTTFITFMSSTTESLGLSLDISRPIRNFIGAGYVSRAEQLRPPEAAFLGDERKHP